MQIIIPSSGNTMKILGNPKGSEDGYRFMNYVLIQKVEDGVLLFHLLTRELLFLMPEEFRAWEMMPELREKWFVVPMSMNDQDYADRVRFICKTLQKKKKNITSYTVFTTMDCNARCFYCYEMGRPRISMSEDTAHKVASYMADHCGGEEVKLHWFGGEPLYNKKVIDIICQDLLAKDVSYSSTMITNAYLFDAENVKKAVELWKMKSVQITLDGTETLYNRSKSYIYTDGISPYQIVMSNIARLLEVGVRVTVRMNIDEHNADDLLLLADELHERFHDKKGLRAYSHVLFEYAGERERERDEVKRKQLYQKQQRLIERLVEYGLKKHRLKKHLPVNLCMADSGDALTVLPKGDLGLCEHYSEDHYAGHIDHEGINEEIVKQFRENRAQIEACHECFYYPECIRLRMCLEQRECFPEMRELHKQDILAAMKYHYGAWRNKETVLEEELPENC